MNNTRVGWVAEPEGRGTAGLLYSCLFTIFLSTWTAYHPNVKKSRSKAFWEKVGKTVVFIFAPEFLVWHAIEEWRTSKELQFAYSELTVENSGQPPSKIEDVGTGRALLSQSPTNMGDAETGRPFPTTLSMTLAYFLQMKGIVIRSSDLRPIQPNNEGRVGSFVLLKAAGVSIESVSMEEIEDKSKSDSFSRLLACFQVSWLFVQLIGRDVANLPISTLELFTASNAACAVVSYMIWWNKPKDVGRPIILQSKISYQGIQDRKKACDTSPPLTYPQRYENMVPGVVTFAILLASLSIFGWSFSFPTYAEQLTWRILSILLSILAIVFLCINVYETNLEYLVGKKLYGAVGWSAILLYGFARLYFIIEIFTGLRSSPPALYFTVNWSQYFPHL